MNPFEITNYDEQEQVLIKEDSIEFPDSKILVSDYIDVQYRIAKERNESISDLHKDMTTISEISTMLGFMINEQGENLETISTQIEDTVINTEIGKKNLEKAAEYMKDGMVLIRDISIIIGGGVLGTTGFFLGPIVGIGTVVGGVAGGSAVVAGIHRAANNRK